MKTVFTIACLTICMLASFGFEAEKDVYSRSWALSDPLLVVLALVCVWQVTTGRWKLDIPSLFLGGNVLILGLSGLFNQRLANGTFLNFTRTALGGWLLYTVTSNVVNNRRDLRKVSLFAVLFGIVAYVLSVPNLRAAWAGGFDNSVRVFGVTDLNSYGFLFVLLFCASAPLWLAWSDVFRGLIVGGGLACGAFLSLSRSAASNLVIAAAIIFTISGARSSRNRLVRGATLLLVLAAAGFLITRVSEALPGAAQFEQAKLDDFGNDAVNTRVIDLTFRPIAEWIQQDFAILLFGDAASFQHTFLANALWFTGLFGLVCGVGIYFAMGRIGWLAWKRSRNNDRRLAAACYLAMVIVMVVDDSVTNHRYHSQLLSYLFFTFGGAFSGFLKRSAVTFSSLSASPRPPSNRNAEADYSAPTLEFH